ncbi:hypothetical protein BpHYR1_020536 [Brachionus plicatilis]|uniref:Uncharacterized protein n=1 Tax=Brachionus plicatilis TaxID=10195 RepID=A0A3M7S7R7_BRAPC|nr:hypothetical protein BpHYR1_020536 [Brachionus plicatilis]
MSYKIEQNLDRILGSKNWNNILLRYRVREELVKLDFDPDKAAKYLHQLDDKNLIEFRSRIFKLARDFYFEILLLETLGPKPILVNDIDPNQSLNYTKRCKLVQHCLEFFRYLTDYSNDQDYFLPSKCVCFSTKKVNFPLGKSFLEKQMNGWKNIKTKVINLSSEMTNFKSLSSDCDKKENNLLACKKKIVQLKEQNDTLKIIMTI